MLLWLAHYLMHYYPAFRVFDYLTFRSIISALSTLIFVLCLGPVFIRRLKARQIRQTIREDGPKSHLSKSGTPTMGGILILLSVAMSLLLWGDLSNPNTWLLLATMIGFGLIGFLDDYLKVRDVSSAGLPGRWKLCLQLLLGLLVAIYLYATHQYAAQISLFVPFFKHVAPNLGWFFIVVTCLMLVGSSNAVNLTDGLDGLALMPSILIAAALAFFCYLTGNELFSHYLAIPFIPGVGEVAIFCSAIVGAGLGFLWYNTYPAQVFMGDVGSLGLGASLALVAILVRQEIVFLFMGGIFVLETASVILQVASFKLTGKRIFRMAPIHHHFELKGWAEPKVIVRFWIITFILVLLGLATLKLR